MGSLVGCNEGTISNASAQGEATSKTDKKKTNTLGGLVGENVGGIISHSGANMILDSHSLRLAIVGGLVGWMVEGEGGEGVITNSHASGSAFAVSQSWYVVVGGLSGYGGTIDQSYATGSIHGRVLDNPYCDVSILGGLVGYYADVTNSYATASVEACDCSEAGGLAGALVSATTSYAVGPVHGSHQDTEIGGFAGLDRGSAMDYWDTDTSQQSNGCGSGTCSGITGLTDSQLKSGLPAGFDPAIWGQSASINNGYPYLLANPPL